MSRDDTTSIILNDGLLLFEPAYVGDGRAATDAIAELFYT
jgi:hypothetical protein